MAYYNSAGTPRFFINLLDWLYGHNSLILDNEQADRKLLQTLPVNPIYLDHSWIGWETPLSGMTSNGFIAILGHNMALLSAGYAVYEGSNQATFTDDVSVNGSGNTATTQYDGFSINTFTGNENISDININNNPNIGSIILGTYFDMPHSADLKLTLEYQTGTKTIETRGGASLSNTMTQPPKWGNLAQWELSDPYSSTVEQALVHNSRRIWNLSFSFLSKESTFPKYNALNRYTNEDLSDSDLLDNAEETLLDSDNFMSQVWERCTTASPFIFQPDKDTPEFAICKFEKDISFQQTAPGLYSVKCRIREVW